MQLPDEAITYQYLSLMVPAKEDWTAAAELRAQHFLPLQAVKDVLPRLAQVRSQVAAEREPRPVPPEMQPLEAGFIDLPQKTLDEHRKKGEASLLGRVLTHAARLRDQCDRVVVLGVGGATLGARALFGALRSSCHNELSAETRLGVPRVYFGGDACDNDSLQELLDLLQHSCVDPEIREERWGVVVVSKSGTSLETAAAYRAIRRELAEYYGLHSPRCKELAVPVTGTSGKLRDLARADGLKDEEILTIPDDVGGRFSVFSAAGLLPAAVMGLDVRALLLGAAAMTRRFLEEPFERNPVLQFAAINHLMSAQRGKTVRVLAIWSKKLEALGPWYEQLVAQSLGKQGQGPTPVTTVQSRDLHARGQLHQEGPRDKLLTNLVVKTPRLPPIQVGMMDGNADDLNQYNRKALPDLLDAALRGVNQASAESARPTADLVVPALSEHTMGQLLQMLMLATIVEGRLMGINPYSQPGVEVYKKLWREYLKGQ
jgi:glucose-6-phosphate isomerase